jgi:hypothetical protein
MASNMEQKDVWSFENVEIERETHELIKSDKSNSIVLEFPNINTSRVKMEEKKI